MRSSVTLCISLAVALLMALTAGLCNAGEAAKPSKPNKPKPPYFPEFQDPLVYGDEFVEVTENNTLRRRYHDRDYEKDLAFYTKRAKANAELHEPNTMKMLMVLCKDVRVTSKVLKDEDGEPISGIYGASDKPIENIEIDNTSNGQTSSASKPRKFCRRVAVTVIRKKTVTVEINFSRRLRKINMTVSNLLA